MHKKKSLTAAVGLALAIAAAPALADITWSMTGSDSCGNGCGGTPGNSRPFSSGGVNLSATAWANTINASNTQIEEAYLGIYGGGLGVKNKDGPSNDSGEWSSPEHSVDNSERQDAVLLSFNATINLTSVSIGYANGDSDVSVLAYTSQTTPFNANTQLKNLTYAQLLTNGWELVGNYFNLASTSNQAAVSTAKESRNWLVMAFAPTYCTGSCTNDSSVDRVKINAVSGNTRVPEPGTLVLLGAAALGFWRLRRSGA
jgi:hypothetical protein